MLLFRALLFLSVPALTCAATRPPELAALAERAASLPPEFAADGLLRIAGSSKVADSAWKRELIESAFHLASASQQPFARRNWSGARANLFDKAYSQGLDALTLESRAISAMLPLDPRRARAMLAEFPTPKVPRLTCEDALVYDVSALYATLGEVVMRGFTPREIAKSEPLHFVQPYIAELSSSVQVGPIANLIAGLQFRADSLAPLVDTLAAGLKHLPGDDRSFAASVSGNADAAASIAALASICSRAGVSPLPLLEAWREYLVKSLSGARCADTAGAPARHTSFGVASPATPEFPYSGTPGIVRFFNEKMRDGSLRPIGDDETVPSKVEGKARDLGACEWPQCLDFSKQYMNLVLGPKGIPLSEEQKAGSEWNGRLRAYLDALAAWDGGDKADEAFQWKSRFYMDAFNLAPNGPDRDLILTAFLAWLQRNSYQQDHRVEWFYPVNALLIRVFGDAGVMKNAMRDLLNSGDAVIAFYARLEQVAPRAMGRAIQMM
ncbi:MAG: hypothetical protein U0Q18_15465 [Bryobacteraceae bacterium]